MSLRRRLMVYLIVCAPVVWAVGLFGAMKQARHEVDELFDTQMVRLARHVQATLDRQSGRNGKGLPAPTTSTSETDATELGDMAITVWNAREGGVIADQHGMQLPSRPPGTGFVEQQLDGQPWRVYYLASADGEWVVAAGQKAVERSDLVRDLIASQMLPWLLVLPLLLAAMAWAVGRALAPVRDLTDEIGARDAGDLKPVPEHRAPSELKPLVAAMNGLFTRIDSALERERRFTADAAHELRTPLAVLRAQWDVVRRSSGEAERRDAESKLTLGFAQMDRLVAQMLSLSRIEAGNTPPTSKEIDWPAIVEQVVSDCLPLAERRRIEIGCDWPPEGRHPMPLLGDPALLTVMLRNLLDNAIRYAPVGSTVTLRFGEDRLEVDNDGEPLAAEQLSRMGERFHRPAGQLEGGSGLGVSIVRRIATMHRLVVTFGRCDDGRGVRVTLTFEPSPR